MAGRPAGARATTAVPPPRGRIAALYGAREQRITIDQALSDVAGVLPNANPNNDFRAALHRLHPPASPKDMGAARIPAPDLRIGSRYGSGGLAVPASRRVVLDAVLWMAHPACMGCVPGSGVSSRPACRQWMR
jgi:hypothetical protein